ncbi:MAG: MG2 domain-containing protein [Phycisphaerales bacterium]|nr:MG2 domain-containing protein [Phycisphaerales bacterium]
MMRLMGLALLVVALVVPCFVFAADEGGGQKTSAELREAFKKDNFKDAYDGLSKLVLSPEGTDALSEDFRLCTYALEKLGRVDEIDDFREKAIAVHAQDWRFLWAAAMNYADVWHCGNIIAGKFHRGSPRGKWVIVFDRDRVRALQFMTQAMTILAKTEHRPDKEELGKFYNNLATILLRGSDGYYGSTEDAAGWRLQFLTDLTRLSDYDDSPDRYNWRPSSRGAPVGPDGKPIFHSLPKSWDAAVSDGQRYRWAIAQASEMSASWGTQSKLEWVRFLNSQFGVQTMAEYSSFFRGKDENGKKDESGPFAVYTLKDNETIAKLANGIKRFALPDEFNPIKILQEMTTDREGKHMDSYTFGVAMDMLAETYEDRQQYNTAADCWKKALARSGSGYRQQRFEQITKNWGMFENTLTQPVGDKGAKVDFRFRNANKVSFTANEINVPSLLADMKDYINAKPNQCDWQKIDLSNIGWRILNNDQKKYIGKEIAAWDLALEPRPDHFDRRITVQTPLKKAGAYLLVGKLPDGNISRIVIWIADTVIVRKPMPDAFYAYVADAATGQPLQGVTVNYFGYTQTWQDGTKNYLTSTTEFSNETDADGQSLVAASRVPKDGYSWQWLVIATTKGQDNMPARLAFSGLSYIWFPSYENAYDWQYNRTKAFFMTDRPVYRPGQKVEWKVWIGNNQYDQDGKSPYAGRTTSVEIRNPKNEVLQSVSGTCDDFGGLSGTLTLENEATLGVYRINDANSGLGGTTFRVEEYKKPEFEVKVDAPTEAAMLGETVTASIKANYYFGAPVINAKVKYKVTRTAYSANWYPAGLWDWFYEPGYWWFAPDYYWYPGWSRWGCNRPIHSWWSGRWSNQQPEIVLENEVPIGPDGTVKLDIDTSVAKAAYSDQDHRYEITAEVTDASRRTIVGTGQVLVARQPFKVYAWVNRGYYHVGDAIEASFKAQTLDNNPVKGTGSIKLFKIAYDAKAQPVETEVQRWKLDTNDRGEATQQIKAQAPGQYRLSYTMTDAKNHEIEGGYVFLIRGDPSAPDSAGGSFRFNDIEITTDKKEYAAGDKVKLLVNADRENATVLLFVRPSNGVYLAPKVIRLKGKSAVEEIEVGKKDMPNFFVEALTVSSAKIFTDVREVIVPPADRILNVAVTADAAEYKPGQKAKLTVKVTEKNGEPFTGAAVLSLYDKSVEYISGGSNVADIRKYFWQWRRYHYVRIDSSLDKWSGNITLSGETAMSFLGAFGYMATDYGINNEEPASLYDSDAKDKGGGQFAKNQKAGSKLLSLASPTPVACPAPAEAIAATFPVARGGTGFLALSGSNTVASGAPEVEPAVRQNFADTALWAPSLITAKDGLATVEVSMPENLTTWKAKVWTLGNGSRVGQAETEIITKKNLIVRLQAPRFFVETDQVVLSANVHNYLKQAKDVKVSLECEGGTIAPPVGMDWDGKSLWRWERKIRVEPNGEQRVDWPVNVFKEGTALIRMKAITDEESDATQQSFPVYVHGMLKTESFSGAITQSKIENQKSKIEITVPKERRPEQSRLEIRYSPTLAGAMVDALPYMVDYPYGCTEQTLNRFVPTMITQKVLLDMNLDLAAIQKKITNLNAQEIGDDAERAKDWGHKGSSPYQLRRPDYKNPVFDQGEVVKMVREGVTRLSNMQCGDGGWGWFSGYGERSWPHTTATVVHGLQLAKASGALEGGVDQPVLDRGIQWLKRYQEEQVQAIQNWDANQKDNGNRSPAKPNADETDAFVYIVLLDADVNNAAMKDYLYRDRAKLAVYAKAMFALALHKAKDNDKLNMLLDNIKQFLVQDDENQTAYLKMPEGYAWWYWYNSDVEANAYYLKLLSKTNPKGEAASRLAKYLMNNRKHATYWNSTRDSAICIEALADYWRASGEDKPNMTVRISIDGKQLKEVKITPEDIFSFDNKLVLEGNALTDGKHQIDISREGTGPLYFNAYLTNFTMEPHITHAGLEIKVNRKVYLLTRAEKTVKAEGDRGQVVDQKVEKYIRTELADGQTVKSGDLVEIELEVDSKNDYEYIILEDMKAAGFEPVEVHSGYNGNDMNAYVEFHDNRVSFFVHRLAHGKHSVSYRLRAEIPGSFSALPSKAAAMYAPELKANSDEIKLEIVDAQ